MSERTSKSSGGGTRAVASKARAAGTAASRADRAAERRAAIVQAAMDEFIARGFAATRLDDIAKRAGVAKGTIYLHFKDKESMFEELIRTAIVPFVSRLAAPPPSGSVRDMIEALARMFLQEIAGTRRADLVRLIIAEGPRFPAIVDFYYREVVSRVLAAMRALIQIAIARGEICEPKLVQFPQLMIAPMVVAVLWKSLFERHAPLDAEAMLQTHLDLIFGARRPT
ncbi:MAG: TetR/AcrR family transcriptional regulator [Bradyrhizobium sp.]